MKELSKGKIPHGKYVSVESEVSRLDRRPLPSGAQQIFPSTRGTAEQTTPFIRGTADIPFHQGDSRHSLPLEAHQPFPSIRGPAHMPFNKVRSSHSLPLKAQETFFSIRVSVNIPFNQGHSIHCKSGRSKIETYFTKIVFYIVDYDICICFHTI